MTNYHINTHQEVKICKAQQRKCRFGENVHSESVDELYTIIENINKKDNPYTTTIKKNNATVKNTTRQEKTKIKKNSETQTSMSQNDVDELTKNMFEEYETMKNSVSEDEFAALFAYSGNGYNAINETLRGNINEKHKNGIKHRTHYEKAAERIELIDNVMSQYGTGKDKPEKTLYRFQALDKKQNIEDFIQKNFPQGDIIEEKGYMSTSEDLAFVLGHTDNHINSDDSKYILFEIKTSKGVSLQENPIEKPHKLQSLEKERLLPRDMKFTVDNIEKRTMQIDESRKNIQVKYFWDPSRQQKREMNPREYFVVTLTDQDNASNVEND